jgi:hypothetical protein
LRSATVVASTSVVANAIATTLAVMGKEEALGLVAKVPGAECVLVTSAGAIVKSAGWDRRTEFCADEPKKDDKPKGVAWPEGFQMAINLEIPKVDAGKRYRRPYVAVWIEDAAGKPVKTLAVWGNSPKWLKDLSDWYKFARDDKDLIKAITKATRNPGKYDLAWDGKDEKGNAVPQGTYTVKVEVHREHGKHVRQTGKIDCQGKEATVKMDKNEESGEVSVTFGKKK